MKTFALNFLIFSVMLCVSTTVFSQAGQKWSTSGNATTSGDFIGSTNNEPLKFKTNDIVRGKFTKDGDFLLKSLTGSGFRLLQTDSTGTLSSFPMSSANEVLYGDGIWRPLPTPPPATWELNGTTLYYLNGKVGIGTKTPLTNFDVIGDAYISNNLYVGGGIIITEKVNASKEILTSDLRATALRTDSIVMDSTKGVYGYSIFKDRVKLENKLEVDGNTQINGDFSVNGDFIFGDNKRIGYLPPFGGDPEVISFGGPPIGIGTFCTLPTVTAPTINQFGAMIQIYGKSDYSPTGNMNVLNIGYDGANGIIDMRGQYTDGSDSKLLINWYCGQDVAINTNPAKGGNVTITSATTGMVGIGTAPTAKLDVLGTFKLRDGSQGANRVLVSDASGLASWQDPSTIEDGDWTINGTDIYRLTGNVGIGTADAYKMLTVNGDVSLANYNNSGGGNMGNGMSGLEILGMNQIPTRRGISLDSDPNGSFNFFINSNQTTSSFNFKNGNGTPTTLMTIMGNGNVGIGTDNPLGKFQVGEGFNKVNIGFLSGDENSNCITSYLGFNAAKTDAGWVFNTNGVHNGGAVIMASSSGQLNFIIKRNPNGESLGSECSPSTGTSDETLDNNQLLARTKMVIDPFGNVGIGTTTPAKTLDVSGTLRVGDGNTNFLDIWYDGAHNIIDANGADLLINYYADKNCVIGPGSLTASGVFTAQKDAFFDANVGIGTTAVSGARLSVEGFIRAREVIVNLSTWSDFVFEPTYQLRSLQQVENYILANKHLPDVPSEKEVIEKGVSLGEMNAVLLQKIEELTLYIIALNKRMEQLDAENNTMKNTLPIKK